MFAVGYIKYSTWARCTERVPAHAVDPGSADPAEGKSKTPNSLSQGKSGSCLGCAEILSLGCLTY